MLRNVNHEGDTPFTSLQFDATRYAPTLLNVKRLFAPGVYRVTINDAFITQRLVGVSTADVAFLKFKVAGGDFDGSTFYDNYIVDHTNPAIKRKGRHNLANVCAAAKRLRFDDITMLIGRALCVDVSLNSAEVGEIQGFKNSIENYLYFDATTVEEMPTRVQLAELLNADTQPEPE